MDRILAFSDLHGQFQKAKEALEKAKWNPDNTLLVFCGDMIDRGPESKECVQWMRGLKDLGAVILRGNHEKMLSDWLKDPAEMYWYLWPNNGGPATLESYGCDKVPYTYGSRGYALTKELQKDAEWLGSLPLTHTHGEYVFVHAGFNVDRPLAHQSEHDMLWIYEDWIYSKRPHDLGKTVVYGHSMTCRWVSSFLLPYDPEGYKEWALSGASVFHEDDRICVDVGAGAGRPVSVYDITNMTEYRSST